MVCLALANTDWYMRQLRENPARPAVPSQEPALRRDAIPERPTWPLHGLVLRTSSERLQCVPGLSGEFRLDQ